MRRFGKALVSLLGICVLCIVSVLEAEAALYITEIAYNPEGGDTSREWIEIHNTSEDLVHPSEYSFKEQGVNHRIEPAVGEKALASGARAVIVDSVASFQADYPNYSGIIFDSSFSLKNSGEELLLINSQDQVEFRVTYNPETGGDGDGSSLGLIGDIWQSTNPSPGAVNKPYQAQEQEQSNEDSQSTSTTEAEDSTNTQKPTQNEDTQPVDTSPATYLELKYPDYEEKAIKVEAGEDRVVMAGVAYYYTGTVYGLTGGKLEDPQVRWNWGDGTTGSGQTDQHTFAYPGEYTITLSAVVQRYSDHDRVQVEVIPPALKLVLHPEQEGVIGIRNESAYHLELSRYELSNGDHSYTFPQDTFVNTGNTLYLSTSTLGFAPELAETLRLTDGVGAEIDSIVIAQARLEKQIAQHKEQAEVLPATKEQVVATQDNITHDAPTHSVAYQQISTHDQEPQEQALAQVHLQGGTNPSASQEATVFRAQEQSAISYQTWIMLGLLLLAGAGYLYIYSSRTPRDPAEEIDIID